LKLHYKIVLVALVGLAAPDRAHSSASGSSVKGEVVEYGLTRSIGEQRTLSNPDTLDGKQTFARGPKFIEHTDRVPAKLGAEFGFTFQVTGLGEQRSVELRKVVKHPSMKNAKGVNEVEYATNITVPVRNGEARFGAGYKLERAEELKPGTWTFEIFYRDQKLLSQSFTVYAAK
jgi:hypothetical protein